MVDADEARRDRQRKAGAALLLLLLLMRGRRRKKAGSEWETDATERSTREVIVTETATEKSVTGDKFVSYVDDVYGEPAVGGPGLGPVGVPTAAPGPVSVASPTAAPSPTSLPTYNPNPTPGRGPWLPPVRAPEPGRAPVVQAQPEPARFNAYTSDEFSQPAPTAGAVVATPSAPATSSGGASLGGSRGQFFNPLAEAVGLPPIAALPVGGAVVPGVAAAGAGVAAVAARASAPVAEAAGLASGAARALPTAAEIGHALQGGLAALGVASLVERVRGAEAPRVAQAGPPRVSVWEEGREEVDASDKLGVGGGENPLALFRRAERAAEDAVHKLRGSGGAFTGSFFSGAPGSGYYGSGGEMILP